MNAPIGFHFSKIFQEIGEIFVINLDIVYNCYQIRWVCLRESLKFVVSLSLLRDWNYHPCIKARDKTAPQLQENLRILWGNFDEYSLLNKDSLILSSSSWILWIEFMIFLILHNTSDENRYLLSLLLYSPCICSNIGI